jgi:cytosine/adenosine deaminase-related metal-dependent hydrolase
MRWPSSGCSGGLTNIEHLASLSLATRLVRRSLRWVDEREQQLLSDHGVKVMHRPSSNLKLRVGRGAGAGNAGARYHGVARHGRRRGNNRLDMFDEMRMAAWCRPRRQPGVIVAREVRGWRRAPVRGRSG